MITVDANEVKDEIHSLSDFLKSKTETLIDVKSGKLVLHLEEKKVSDIDVKTLVKRFLHREGLSEVYRVTKERNVIKISKRKNKQNRRTERKGVGPSSYQTVPYYFPNHP